jgi:hypothetical protein
MSYFREVRRGAGKRKGQEEEREKKKIIDTSASKKELLCDPKGHEG